MPRGHVRESESQSRIFGAEFLPGFPKPRRPPRGVECGNFPSWLFMLLADRVSDVLGKVQLFPRTLLSRRAALLGAVILLFAAILAHAADDRNPLADDPKAAKAGEYEFRINCALCHGLGAHGGGRGPDLTRAQKKHVHSDAEMFQVISNGIPGTAMPANGTNGQGVGMTDEEIWQIITYIRSQEVKAPATPVGNAENGKRLFYGDADCSLCHMIAGKGGRVGPELTSVGGSRTRASIIDSVRNPSRRLAWGLTEATKEFPQEYETVTVVTADGKEIKGVALNEDNFSVQMIDTSEHICLFDKDKLRSFKKSRESMMPKYTPEVLSDKDLDDIVAYLISVGTK
jgi:cytochrome c oxidase cbb3-type subunit III